MNHGNDGTHVILGPLKATIIGILKMVALITGFTLQVASIILAKISEVLLKLAGYGTTH